MELNILCEESLNSTVIYKWETYSTAIVTIMNTCLVKGLSTTYSTTEHIRPAFMHKAACGGASQKQPDEDTWNWTLSWSKNTVYMITESRNSASISVYEDTVEKFVYQLDIASVSTRGYRSVSTVNKFLNRSFFAIYRTFYNVATPKSHDLVEVWILDAIKLFVVFMSFRWSHLKARLQQLAVLEHSL